jgi:allantoin racemase
MKLLLINPNTTQRITDTLVVQAQKAVGAAVTVVGLTAKTGPAIIRSAEDNVVAEQSMLDMATTQHAGFDAVLLGVSMDTALQQVRAKLPIPVVGMTEGGLLTACLLGQRVGCLTLGSQMADLYEQLSSSYGLSTRVVKWHAPNISAAYETGPNPALIEALVKECEVLTDQYQAEVIVLCAAVLTGYAGWLAPHLRVPVVDSIEAAALQAVGLARLRLSD